VTSDEIAPRTIGLVLVRPTHQLGAEPFYQELIAGIDRVFGALGFSLLVQVVSNLQEELDTYRRWAAAGRIGGVMLVDLGRSDVRVQLTIELGLAAVVIGEPETAGPLPCVWIDDATAIRTAVQRLAGLGHRTVGRVSGPRAFAHSQIRAEAFLDESSSVGVRAVEIEADYSQESGRLATGELLRLSPRPTAIVYDDDLMALGGLSAVAEAGLTVPGDVSMLAWDDSALCQLSTPKLSALGHDVQAFGELAAGAMLALLRDGVVATHEAPIATFVDRGSVTRRA